MADSSIFAKLKLVNKGFTHIIVILVLVGVVIAALLILKTPKLSIDNPTYERDDTKVSWMFDYNTKTWQVKGTPPACPEPLVFPSPVDISLASGILYPGQVRGGDYKPHGGFRFDNRDTNDIEVRAIMDGYILKASRYEDYGSEIQIFLFYVNDCGIMVMHDHLLVLSSKLQKVFDNIQLNKNGDSRTTEIVPRVYVKKGEILGTKIGYENFPGGYKDKNIFVDFGLYDLRKTNGIVYDSNFRAKFPMIDEYGVHALCWFNYLSKEDEKIVRSLSASGDEGKTSDYCQ